MAIQSEEMEALQEQESSPITTDYPKVQPDKRGTSMPGRVDPIGNIPLSVPQGEVPHHPGADPNAKEAASDSESS